MDIHGYVAKLHHDCGHPDPEKMIDTLMREGCSDYSLGIATEYLTFKESVVEPLLKLGCKWCEKQNHKETEADAEAQTEAPVPEKEIEESRHEKYWRAYSGVPHYMNATQNTRGNKNLMYAFIKAY